MKDNRAIEISRELMMRAFLQNKDKIGLKDFKKLKRLLIGGNKLKKFTLWLKDQITTLSINYDPAPTDLVAKAVKKFKGRKWANNLHLITAVANDHYVKACYNDYIEAKEYGYDNPEQYLDDMEDCIEDWLLNWGDLYKLD